MGTGPHLSGLPTNQDLGVKYRYESHLGRGAASLSAGIRRGELPASIYAKHRRTEEIL